MTILVTGGAGYIGSHTVRQLLAAGYDVVVFDNLSTGFRDAVPTAVPIVDGDIRDTAQVAAALRTHRVAAVIHFAAKTVVPESIAQPADYYDNNTMGVLSIMRACRDAAVRQLVFSSTAAVYGNVASDTLVTETSTADPINPYGRSKLMSEWMLRDGETAYGIRTAILRYFNVAGAAVDGSNGQRTRNATHLIKLAAQAAAGKIAALRVFGTDYPTVDGTAVRDYIHVDDLADIHVQALRYLQTGVAGTTFNCGYGRGYSVAEVIAAMQQVSGVAFDIIQEPRRPGDAMRVVADPTKLQQTLGWKPRHNDLALICRTAFEWERQWQEA